jgi:hypothetical protein
VTVDEGAYRVEWFSINSRETKSAGNLTLERDGSTSFTAPFGGAGPVILYLKAEIN